MREKMTITPVTSPEQVTSLGDWLESFGHKRIENPSGRFHLFTKLDRVLALTQQIQLPALFPAVNPNVCTPRETTEIVACFHHWNANQPHVVAVPSESKMHEKMAALGYKPHAVLYESI